MSVDFDPSKQRWRVRWREQGRQRTRRFLTQEEAVAFDEAMRPEVDRAGAVAAVVEPVGGNAIYAYSTKAGVRYRFAFRQSDGKLSSRRGFTSRRAVDTARRRLVESIERGEVKVARDIFETFWLRWLEERRPYMTSGSLLDFQTHGRKRLLVGQQPVAALSLARHPRLAVLARRGPLLVADVLGDPAVLLVEAETLVGLTLRGHPDQARSPDGAALV